MIEYDNRKERHKYIADNFSRYLNGKVLNVGGGGQNHLLEFIRPKEYLELDINGTPDIKIDLDKEYPIPVETNCFDTVLCTDVLEHLNEFHRVFDELIRISNKYVIISVPNALLSFRSYLFRTKYSGNSGEAGFEVGYFKKYYGLPKTKPIDRHKWFFSFTEAQIFFNNYAAEYSYKVIEEVAIGLESKSFKGKALRIIILKLFGEKVLKDWFCSTYWCVIEKVNNK
jgi:hypothetical protein